MRILLGISLLLVSPVACAFIGGALSADGSFLSGFGGAVIGFAVGVVVGVLSLTRLATRT